MPGCPVKVMSRANVSVSLALGLILLALQPARAQMRTFTDTEGRTVVAELIEADRESIRFRRDDGIVFDLARDRLSESDQQFIDDWIQQRAFTYGGIEVKAWRVRLNSDRDLTKSSVRTTEEWCYKFSVQNHSRMQLDDLTVEYRIFWTDDRANTKTKKLPQLRVEGRTAMGSLDQRESAEFATKTITLRSTELQPGRRYAGTGKRRVADALAGIWIRVMQGDTLLEEYASPTKLTKEEKW